MEVAGLNPAGNANSSERRYFYLVIIMTAYNLKLIANKFNKDQNDPEIEAGYKRLYRDLEELAQQGKYDVTLFLTQLNVSKKIWEAIGERLRKDGFQVEFDTEITAWYSNTDWDQEDVVRISWA